MVGNAEKCVLAGLKALRPWSDLICFFLENHVQVLLL